MNYIVYEETVENLHTMKNTMKHCSFYFLLKGNLTLLACQYHNHKVRVREDEHLQN